MLNYEKTLVVVVYHFNIEGLLELNAEAPIFIQLNEPVANTSIIVAPAALPGRLSSSEYNISYVHNSKIKLVQLNICTKKPKLDHYFSRKSRPLDISYIF